MILLGKNVLSANFIEKQNTVSKMSRKKYSVSTWCLNKILFCRKKLLSPILVGKFVSAALRRETKYFDYEKKHSPHPHPFKLYGCSLIRVMI